VSRVKLDPHQFFRRLPLAPHQLRDAVTRVEDSIVLCHLGVPRIARDDWSLTIDGLLAHPRRIGFADLVGYPKVEVASVHQCAGSPLQPTEPTQRVCNVTWGGARLSDILSTCEPRPAAKYVWSTGADFGEFGGVQIDAYLKDMPIERVQSDVLVAYEMNGAPLKPEHGFPARLFVPGYYGTNSVKWLTRITLAEVRAPSPFTTRWYDDPVLDAAGDATGLSAPVWSIAPQSVIVAPEPGALVHASVEREIWGWAWADGGVRNVDVTVDSGATWMPAALTPLRGRAWQRFSIAWNPRHRGVATLASRATAMTGVTQPPAAQRNAIYRVGMNVT
jgi:DMSO/TMAO reductase YedYZ molybdopterin-dependent catalytic subunit